MFVCTCISTLLLPNYNTGEYQPSRTPFTELHIVQFMSQTLMEINPQEIVVPSNMLVYPLARNGHEAKEHCVPIEV